MTKISDLRDGMRKVNVEATIVDKGRVREVMTYRGPARVANFTIEDDSGTITLTLWNDDIDRVDIGDRVRIENGYVTSFRGKLQLNVGRYGRLIVQE